MAPQQPPPQQPAASGGSGLDTKTASTLAYALWWLTGIIFLVLDGKRDAEIRFHAWQSIIFFGGVTVFNIGLNIIAGITGVYALGLIGSLLYLIAFIVWIIILIQTYQGKRMVLPLAGSIAEQQAAKA